MIKLRILLTLLVASFQIVYGAVDANDTWAQSLVTRYVPENKRTEELYESVKAVPEAQRHWVGEKAALYLAYNPEEQVYMTYAGTRVPTTNEPVFPHDSLSGFSKIACSQGVEWFEEMASLCGMPGDGNNMVVEPWLLGVFGISEDRRAGMLEGLKVVGGSFEAIRNWMIVLKSPHYFNSRLALADVVESLSEYKAQRGLAYVPSEGDVKVRSILFPVEGCLVRYHRDALQRMTSSQEQWYSQMTEILGYKGTSFFSQKQSLSSMAVRQTPEKLAYILQLTRDIHPQMTEELKQFWHVDANFLLTDNVEKYPTFSDEAREQIAQESRNLSQVGREEWSAITTKYMATKQL